MIHHKNWPTLLAYTVSVILFVAVSGYAVMYATGYRLDFQDWTLRKTGVLAITSKPSGATVYLNDKKYSRRTPLTLRNMLPGAYEATLELADYRPFTKTIEIKSGQATEEHNLDLVLSTVAEKTLAEDVGEVVSAGANPIYFNKARQLVRLNGDKIELLDIERLPTNVKSVLKAATSIYLAKKSDSGGTWALGVISSGRKWLVVADIIDGYRGQLFGAPLNQLIAEQLTWMDNDRLLGVTGSTIYAVDLNLNRVNQYTKTALGASYQNGSLYYMVRNSDGSVTLLRDSNVFDEKMGEVVLADLPVGKSYTIVFVGDERSVITTTSGGTTGLWLWDAKSRTADAPAAWQKIASNVGGVWFENHTLKPKLFYTVKRSLMAYDIPTATEKILREFPSALKLLGKRDETLFLNVGEQLKVSDTSGMNVYDIGSINKAAVMLGSNSRQVWILRGGQLLEWTLRQSDSGIFGGLTHWWSAYAINTTAG